MNKCGIYSITNIINGKKYIGSSTKIVKRWTEHRCHLKYNTHTNPILQNAYNKYGKDNFKYEIIEECDISILKETEDKHIILFKTMDRKYGYNIELATRPCQNPESNEKRRQASLGRITTEETRKRLSEALGGENNPMYGKHHSKETKEKMSKRMNGEGNFMFGKTHTKEARKKIRNNMTGEKNWNYGKSISEKHKQILRESKLKYWANKKKLINEQQRKSSDL